MKLLITIITLCFCISTLAQRDTIGMNNDWQFAIDKRSEGLAGKWFTQVLENSRPVQLPHTWNTEDENQNHYGWGWYQKKINIPANWKDKNTVLQFGAVNHTSIIYVNGLKVYENTGDGFNKFTVNLDGKLQYGKDNIITVACNNDYGKNKVPYGNSFDWPNDAGMIRPVAFIVSGKPSISGLQVTPAFHIENGSGTLTIKAAFEDPVNTHLKFSIKISEENQPTRHLIFSSAMKATWNQHDAIMVVQLPKVNPWHFDAPNLYRLELAVEKGNRAVDKISATVGFKEIKFNNGRMYLNGEPIKLMGVEWTAGSNPQYGFAEPDSLIIAMGKLMKNVNCIFSRQHFQQGDVFYDFCDRNGILVQQELPLWGPETPSNDTIRSIAMHQMEQMVKTLYHHASIFAWGVGNELRARDMDMKQLIAALLMKAHELDPSRNTSYVSNTLTQSFYNNPDFVPDAAADGDYLMMNEYGGSWWDLPVAQIGAYLDSVHLSYPGKPFFISEFGLCEPNFKGGDERRIEDLAYHMAVYESKPYIEGAIYFDLTDYRTHYPGTHEENKFRRRIHGIYDMYGRPKPSMKTLRELSSPVEVQSVHSWKKGKLRIAVFGSLGLPQHIVRGYTIYLSDQMDNFHTGKGYPVPELRPGQKIYVEVDDDFNGKGMVTVVRPTGYIVSQKSFY